MEMNNEVVETNDVEVVEEVEAEVVEDVVEEKDEMVNLLDLIDKDDNIKSQFQSEMDRAITRAIQTRDAKHQEELKRQEQRSKMTAEELQQEKERELAERENQLNAYQLKLDKVDYFKTNGLDMNLIDYINVDSKDDIEEKTNELMKVIDTVVENKVKQRLKQNSYEPPQENASETLRLEDLKNLSPEEINKNWNKVKSN